MLAACPGIERAGGSALGAHAAIDKQDAADGIPSAFRQLVASGAL
jgi:hypothetical protein